MSSIEKTIAALRNPIKFRLFLLMKLPMAFIAGLKLQLLTKEEGSISLRYGYLTKNPFRSIYFACLAMAGEMASGVLCIAHSKASVPVSILVVNMEAVFKKKAVGRIVFTSKDGQEIHNAIQESILTGEGKTVIATSTGKDEVGDVVAEFKVTWSFKAKKR